ncbi:MAG: phosphatase PAP2 family protein [Flavobacteriales bacterium]|nr:phosphatase PAP2 family protein [Flavobacteriales bacterium]
MREQAVRTFLIGYAVVIVPAFIAVLLTDRFELHSAVNWHHTAPLDLLFKYGTHLGDGWVPTILALLLLWTNWRAFLMVGASVALSAIVAQLLKHGVFPDMDRPSLFLDQMPGVHLVTGVEMHHHNSFPSGHTTAAYSMCLAYAVLIAQRVPAVLLAFLAAGLGLSRVYLSQHFTEDVVAGASIGTLTAYLVYRWLYFSPFASRNWLDRSPFRRQNQ